MPSLQLSLKQGGQVYIACQADTEDSFIYLLDKIKVLPVIKYEKKIRKHVTSIHYLDMLYDICKKRGFEVYVTDNLEDYHERYKLKLESIKQQRKNEQFSSEYWTDDPENKILNYQAQAVNTCMVAKRFLIGDDMGVGKTPEFIAIMCKAFESGNRKALITTFPELKEQWREEILKFTKIKPEQISIVDPYAKFGCPLKITDKLDLRSRNSPCKTCERKDKCVKERADPKLKLKNQLLAGDIIITHYEALDRIKDFSVKLGFDIFGFDEVSKLKNRTTKMAKAAFKITNSAPSESVIIPMSGTFIENRLEDFYPALTLIDKGILGEWYNFKNRYLVLDYWNNVVGVKKKKFLKNIIDAWIIRRELEEVWHDRPKLVEQTTMCEMEDKQREIYDNAKSGCLEELENKKVEKKINIADIGPLINYLIQLCDTTETMDPKIKESIKIKVLKTLILEQLRRKYKVVIFSFFGRKVIPILEREINKLDVGKVLTITGKVSKPERKIRRSLFCQENDYRFLLCSDVMGYGANLQIAKYVINFDLPWNPAKLSQRIRRLYRRGQTKDIVAYNFVTRNTIEESILEKIAVKRKIFKDFLGSNNLKKTLSLSAMLDLLRK